MKSINVKQTQTASLLALMAKADGKIENIENLNAEAMLECFSKDEIENAMLTYQHSSKTSNDRTYDFEFFTRLTAGEKVEIIKLCWIMAICDGELHEEEEKLFHDFVDQMNNSTRDAALVQMTANNLHRRALNQ